MYCFVDNNNLIEIIYIYAQKITYTQIFILTLLPFQLTSKIFLLINLSNYWFRLPAGTVSSPDSESESEGGVGRADSIQALRGARVAGARTHHTTLHGSTVHLLAAQRRPGDGRPTMSVITIGGSSTSRWFLFARRVSCDVAIRHRSAHAYDEENAFWEAAPAHVPYSLSAVPFINWSSDFCTTLLYYFALRIGVINYKSRIK